MSNKNIIIGIGGSGSRIVDLLFNSNKYKSRIFSFVIDTDLEDLKKINLNNKIALTNNEKVINVVERVGIENIRNWFSIDDDISKQVLITLDMHKGMHQWRNNALLAFVDYINDVEKVKILNGYIDSFFDTEEPIGEAYIVSSICGGTGSGLILPVSYYIVNYVKEKYKKTIKFNYILTCPDIYNNYLINDLKLKSYANSYATLQEINSILNVATGYNKKAQKESKTIIDFKLYLGKEIIFDSFNTKYYTVNSLPFNQIYLQDKIPSINGISTHESIISTLISTLLIDSKNNAQTIEKPYNSIFTTKIDYKYESNIDYIISKKVYDDISKQWLYFYDLGNTTLEDGEDIENYDSSILTKSKDIYNMMLQLSKINNNENYDEVILNRNTEMYDYLIKYNVDDETYFIEKIFKDILEDVKAVKEKIDYKLLKDEIDQSLNVEPFKLLDTAKTKQNKKEKLLNQVKKLNSKVEEFYSELITKIYEDTKVYIKETITPITEKIIKNENDEFVHPVIAFVRLLNIFNTFLPYLNNSKVVNYNILVEKNFKIKLPRYLYQVDEVYKNNSKYYYNENNNRLSEIVLNNNIELIHDIKEDAYCIKKDFHFVMETICNNVQYYYIDAIVNYFEDLIVKYNAVFKSLKKQAKYYNEKVENLKIMNSQNSPLHIKVGSLDSDKEYLYKQFCSTFENYDYDDSLAGKLIYDFVVEFEDDKEEMLRKSLNVYDQMYKHYEIKLQNNKVIQAIKELNMLQIIERGNIFSEEKNIKNIRKELPIFSGGILSPLNIANLDTNNEDCPNVRERAIFPNNLTDYIIKNKKEYDIIFDNDEKILDEFLYKIGSSKHFFEKNDNLDENEIIVTSEIFNMPLYWFNKADDYENGIYFNSLLKVILSNKIKLSELWNPYIEKSTMEQDLLFLNPNEQKRYEENVSKSFIWLLINEKISLNYVDKDEKDLCYYINFGTNKKVLYDNESVKPEELDKLIRYIKKDYNLVNTNSLEFDQYFSKLFRKIRANIEGNYYIDSVENAILHSELIQLLTRNYYHYVDSPVKCADKCLIQVLFETSKNNELNKYATLIIKHIALMIRGQIKKYIEETDLEEDEVFKKVFKSFMLVLNEYIDDLDQLSEVFKWLKKNFV